MTPHEEDIEDCRVARQNGNAEKVIEKLRYHLADLRSTVALADNVGDVFRAIAWENLMALSGFELQSCDYCSDTEVFCDGECPCVKGNKPTSKFSWGIREDD